MADDYEINLSSLHRHQVTPDVGDLGRPQERLRSKTIDKIALVFPELRRVRDREHVKSVALSDLWSATGRCSSLALCTVSGARP